ncbi:MAG: glycerate kinase, partial [Ruminococcaceae bacterium]|nr:glycerate kinase [Oscillospiraceae bacterium]
MKKAILIPDSFKGTMSSFEICAIMEGAIHKTYPEAEVLSIPVADGGEGSVDAFLSAMGGERIPVTVSGPYFEKVEAFFGMLPGKVAVIEMAAAAGLPLVGDNRHAEKTTTYGVGELMKAALDAGCVKLVMGLGGSSTNDGGCGAAAAMGVKFYDKDWQQFVPVGETLGNIAHVDLSGLDARLGDVELVTMCDIDNPLCGETGAAHVFAPQKGADEQTVLMLDAGLAHMAEVVKADLGKEILEVPGAGAAGGMGGGMIAWFG